VEGFRKKFKETPFLEVIGGFFLYNSTGYTPQAMLQNEQMLRALSRWPVEVINLGRYDLIYAQKLFAKEGLDARTAAYPIIKNLISANGVFSSDAAAPPAYLIREISGPRTGSKKIRVGFVGVAEPIKPADSIDITVTDIYAAAKRAIAEARKECDLLIVLAHSELQTAAKIAEENPQADVVIAGNAATVLKPRQVGNTLVVCAAPGNTQEGDLRVYIGADGKFTFKFRSTDLDEIVPDDPQAAAFANAAREERYKFRFNR
jgi:2',3'-cyclic-nucleotide 2'-phosphodiesterase (5'-nucleotidase family)